MGLGVYISERIKIDNNLYLFTIGNSFPAFIHKPSDNKPPIIKFIDFPNLSTVRIEKKETENVYEATFPSRQELIEKNNEKYLSIITSAEKSLLDNTYLNYVKIPLVQTALTAIRSILITLESNYQIDPFIYPRSDRSRLLKYLEFLEDLDYVKREGNIFIEGNRLTIIKHELNKNQSKEELFNRLLADVLRIGYPYMKDYLRLLQIVPYLRIATSYYLPSYQFDELLSIKKADFTNFIARYLYSFYNIRTMAYRGKPDIRLNEQIYDVINCKILVEEEDSIIGNEKIFKDFSQSFGRE